ncbi:MAG: rhomboid family intramembrane serine protease, partial [Planctomycetaceae bacterium]
RTPVTSGLILVSVIAAATLTKFDNFWNLCDRLDRTRYLYFAPILRKDTRIVWEPATIAFRRGEIHRLITPIFLHFDILHLLFNMLWLRTLGAAIEMRRGSWRFALMVVFIAVTSNLAQYLYSHPAFGGMSGVVFGLFGYLWMKSKYDPESGFFMPPQLVFMMMAWMVFCYFGPLNIANAAHTVGLIVGALLGLWTTFRRRVLERR